MMSKRQAHRLFQKTNVQVEFLNKRISDKFLPGSFVFKVLINIQGRLQDIMNGKIKEDAAKVRQMNLLQSEMKVVNSEIKGIIENEKGN
jgi:hypothetical protein